jgi:DNA-binding NarL/FixJ family response regulator
MNVAFVDDDETTLFLTSRVLKAHPLVDKIYTYSSAEHFLETIEDINPDIIISDLNLGIGKMSGVDLFKTLEKNRILKTYDFYLIITDFSPVDKQFLIEKGISGFLEKPVTKEKIDKIISKNG